MNRDGVEIVIGGAGGLARETAAALRACARRGASVRLAGFLDDDPDLVGQVVDDMPVAGPIDLIRSRPGVRLVVATGRPDDYSSRFRIVARLGLSHQRYATVVHPDTHLSDTTTLGNGTIMLAAVVATAGVVIGSHVVVMPSVVLTHDDTVDDYATIGSGVLLAGGVHVGEGAYIGAGAVVREGVSIGPWSMVGMGSIVTRDVPPGELWVGSPARYRRRAPVTHDLVTTSASRVPIRAVGGP